jgi:hypothetical protein
VLDKIKAHPLLAASKLDLPNGSFQRDGTVAILTSFNLFNIKEFSLNPKCSKFLCLKKNFCLGSSPITILFQLSYLFNILIIAFPNISNPLEEFNLPINDIIFFF